MKHYGLWNEEIKAWMMDSNGIIFWTSSSVVAQAQLDLISNPTGWLVKEFIDKGLSLEEWLVHKVQEEQIRRMTGR